MKKFLSILLVLCLTFTLGIALISCDEGDGNTNTNTNTNTDAGAAAGGVTEEQWQEAIKVETFDNVTLRMSGSFVSGYEYEDDFSYTYRVDGDKGSMGDDGVLLNPAEIASLRSVYINTASAILGNFDNFEYDTASGKFKSKSDIVYTVTVMGYNAEIIAKNVTATLDADKNVATVECDMTQNFVENGTPKTYVLNLSMTYSDYGTTVVE